MRALKTLSALMAYLVWCANGSSLTLIWSDAAISFELVLLLRLSPALIVGPILFLLYTASLAAA